jgi:glycosyltransferase involved in cell wall biosynthesis
MAIPRLSIVIPTHNRSASLLRCLASVRADAPEDAEIIVSDDGSSDDTSARMAEAAASEPRLRYLRAANGGPAVARNRGWRAARAPFVAFIDDDCIAAPGWARQLLASLEAHPELAGVEGTTRPEHPPQGPFFHSVTGGKGSYLTCNLAFRTASLQRVGGLDEAFPWPHGEDLDLCYRVRREVGEIGFAASAVVLHSVTPVGPEHFFRRVRYDPSSYRLFVRNPDLFLEATKVVRLPALGRTRPGRLPGFAPIFLYTVAFRMARAYFLLRDEHGWRDRLGGFAIFAACAALSVTQLGACWRAHRAAIAEAAARP